ncbi:precorrin-2 C(20)-methyltransferase [Halanaerobium hydrogeniformans]|uniref:Precorrin-2 C20-methyltransferase n=1 Tax=Halanaerobium hydrogeniformans TaxID=656519 RepID=E4RK98_HALHG|nr:precorrin-2 C(20)-methyltransferase [Halanaerobium hydrogeniformans]ADQ15611.1 precorrin-2 C20-methyltransferase [Halanaerobium hydrogeniformans]
MSAKLYGIGVGAGDPKLLTLKALETLKKVDYIFTPVSAASTESNALNIIDTLFEDSLLQKENKVINLNFEMAKDLKKLKESRLKAAKRINEKLTEDNQVAFITLGDPFLYSTYTYIMKKIQKWQPGVEINTIPGINSIAACTSAQNLPLAEGKENIAIISNLKDEVQLEKIFSIFDTVVILKLSRNFAKVYPVLQKLNLKDKVLIGSKCGLKEEKYTTNIEVLNNEEIDYLTLMIVKRKGI